MNDVLDEQTRLRVAEVIGYRAASIMTWHEAIDKLIDTISDLQWEMKEEASRRDEQA